jgi:hypothetical protein
MGCLSAVFFVALLAAAVVSRVVLITGCYYRLLVKGNPVKQCPN